jgi:hypothetical protein
MRTNQSKICKVLLTIPLKWEKFVRRKKRQVYSHSNQDSEEDEDDSPDERNNKADLEMKRDYETWTECRYENT